MFGKYFPIRCTVKYTRTVSSLLDTTEKTMISYANKGIGQYFFEHPVQSLQQTIMVIEIIQNRFKLLSG